MAFFKKGDDVKLDEGEVLSVIFEEPYFPTNENEDREKWIFEFEHNISSPIDYIQSKYGLDEDEAIEKHEKTKELNQSLTPQQQALEDAFNEGEEDGEEEEL